MKIGFFKIYFYLCCALHKVDVVPYSLHTQIRSVCHVCAGDSECQQESSEVGVTGVGELRDMMQQTEFRAFGRTRSTLNY